MNTTIDQYNIHALVEAIYTRITNQEQRLDIYYVGVGWKPSIALNFNTKKYMIRRALKVLYNSEDAAAVRVFNGNAIETTCEIVCLNTSDDIIIDKLCADTHEDLASVVRPTVDAVRTNIFNFAGENAYYSCTSCGLELHGDEVGRVAAGSTYANGEFAPCPTCGVENSIDRDDNEDT